MSSAPASDWVRRWAPQWRAGQSALDLACGSGRHTRLLLEQGLRVTAVDRDAQALLDLPPEARVLCSDLEGGPWPLTGERFDVVLVTHYLWRPLLPLIVDAVADGGWLVYETFAVGQELFGRPRNPDFLLQPGELLASCHGKLHVLAYEDGIVNVTRIQRVAARRLGAQLPLLESPASQEKRP